MAWSEKEIRDHWAEYRAFLARCGHVDSKHLVKAFEDVWRDTASLRAELAELKKENERLEAVAFHEGEDSNAWSAAVIHKDGVIAALEKEVATAQESESLAMKLAAQGETQLDYAQLALWRNVCSESWREGFDDDVCSELTVLWNEMIKFGALEGYGEKWNKLLQRYPHDAKGRPMASERDENGVHRDPWKRAEEAEARLATLEAERDALDRAMLADLGRKDVTAAQIVDSLWHHFKRRAASQKGKPDEHE